MVDDYERQLLARRVRSGRVGAGLALLGALLMFMTGIVWGYRPFDPGATDPFAFGSVVVGMIALPLLFWAQLPTNPGTVDQGELGDLKVPPAPAWVRVLARLFILADLLLLGGYGGPFVAVFALIAFTFLMGARRSWLDANEARAVLETDA